MLICYYTHLTELKKLCYEKRNLVVLELQVISKKSIW